MSKRNLKKLRKENESLKEMCARKMAPSTDPILDAILQMELLGHNFFVFCNAETDQVNVVYKRKGNTYGLIEPEF